MGKLAAENWSLNDRESAMSESEMGDRNPPTSPPLRSWESDCTFIETHLSASENGLLSAPAGCKRMHWTRQYIRPDRSAFRIYTARMQERHVKKSTVLSIQLLSSYTHSSRAWGSSCPRLDKNSLDGTTVLHCTVAARMSWWADLEAHTTTSRDNGLRSIVLYAQHIIGHKMYLFTWIPPYMFSASTAYTVHMSIDFGSGPVLRRHSTAVMNRFIATRTSPCPEMPCLLTTATERTRIHNAIEAVCTWSSHHILLSTWRNRSIHSYVRRLQTVAVTFQSKWVTEKGSAASNHAF